MKEIELLRKIREEILEIENSCSMYSIEWRVIRSDLMIKFDNLSKFLENKRDNDILKSWFANENI